MEEATSYFIETHGNGDAHDQLVKWELAEVTGAIQAEQETCAGWWSTMFKTPSERKKLVIGMWHLHIALGIFG